MRNFKNSNQNRANLQLYVRLKFCLKAKILLTGGQSILTVKINFLDKYDL